MKEIATKCLFNISHNFSVCFSVVDNGNGLSSLTQLNTNLSSCSKQSRHFLLASPKSMKKKKQYNKYFLSSFYCLIFFGVITILLHIYCFHVDDSSLLFLFFFFFYSLLLLFIMCIDSVFLQNAHRTRYCS